MSELGSIPPLSVASSPSRSVLGPLHEPMFRSLWIAAVISYTGRWMQTVGAGWLMTSLTMSPLMVGLVQAASSIAVFLVVLPAGAIADLIDRRKLLLFTQAWMVITAAALGVLTLAHLVTPMLLLLFTFLIGFGAVLNDPAWQAITPEVVSHQNLASGIALNSAGYNMARAIGPAVGGVIIAASNSGTVFLLNAASLSGVIYFLWRWERHPGPSFVRADHMFKSMFDGFRYLRTSHTMQSVLVRSAAFSIAATAMPALLPLLAHPFGSLGYGLLLAFFGVGAVIGATLLPELRRRMSVDALIATSTVIFAAMTFAAGRWQAFLVLAIANLIGGIAWIEVLASLNVSAQTMSPVAMRARAISMYLLILQGGFAGGAAIWGAIAERWGMQLSLRYAAVALLAGTATTYWFRLHPIAIQPNTVGMD